MRTTTHVIWGGIRYLFQPRYGRATRPNAAGVYTQSFAPALIEAVDAMFSGVSSMSLRAVLFQPGVLCHRWCCWLRFHWSEGDAVARAMGGIGDLCCRSAPMTCTDAVG